MRKNVRNNKWLLLIIYILVILLLISFYLLYKSQQKTTPTIRTKAKVIKVIDGDTVKIEGGLRVRYIGIDAPAIASMSGLPDACYGREALSINKQLVEGQEIELEKDLSETDRYGRLLRYVYLGNVFINDYLIRNGYVTLFTLSPDVKYQSQFSQAEAQAKANKRGLWNSCY